MWKKFICEKNTHGAIVDKNEKKTHGITREKLMTIRVLMDMN